MTMIKIRTDDFEQLEQGCVAACDSIMQDLCALFEISQAMVQHEYIDESYRHKLNMLVGASFALIHAINITFPGGSEDEQAFNDSTETEIGKA